MLIRRTVVIFTLAAGLALFLPAPALAVPEESPSQSSASESGRLDAEIAELLGALANAQARLSAELAALQSALRGADGGAHDTSTLAEQVERDLTAIEVAAGELSDRVEDRVKLGGGPPGADASDRRDAKGHKTKKEQKSDKAKKSDKKNKKSDAKGSKTDRPATAAGAGGATGAPPAVAAPAPTDPTGAAVLVAAGDIADCGSRGDEATAALLDRIEGTVATLGDNVYPSGTAAQFADCYDPSWGRHKARTRPAPGNHDYNTAGGAGYYGYFGAAAGEPDKGYYSYDLGGWHVVALNSNCASVGGCRAGSPQEQWLRADLAAHPTTCTLAYWHHPRFSSGKHGSTPAMQPIWQALYDAGADVVLSGHDHLYERFAPQDPGGAADPARGIRQFTVGTGGKSHYKFARSLPNSQMRHSGTAGVLKLALHPAGYDWEFVPAAGGTFTDSGSASCH